MNIFVNTEEDRPRAGWRLLLQFMLFLILVLVMMLVKNALINSSLKIYEALIMGIAGTASVWIAAIILDKRPFREFGMAWHSTYIKELGIGLALGTGAMAVIFGIAWLAGWVSISGFGWMRASPLPYYIWILSYFVAMIIVGFYEELIFRGYQILNMTEGFHSSKLDIQKAAILGVLISSVIFGILHAGNPNATVISTLNIILAGIMLAIPFLVTGSLAISIGIHISWNFIQGGLFGFAVSGTVFRGSIIQIKHNGATYITGGNFGPEAGLLGIFGMILIFVLFVIYINRQGGSMSIHHSFKNRILKSAKQDE